MKKNNVSKAFRKTVDVVANLATDVVTGMVVEKTVKATLSQVINNQIAVEISGVTGYCAGVVVGDAIYNYAKSSIKNAVVTAKIKKADKTA